MDRASSHAEPFNVCCLRARSQGTKFGELACGGIDFVCKAAESLARDGFAGKIEYIVRWIIDWSVISLDRQGCGADLGETARSGIY